MLLLLICTRGVSSVNVQSMFFCDANVVIQKTFKNIVSHRADKLCFIHDSVDFIMLIPSCRLHDYTSAY